MILGWALLFLDATVLIYAAGVGTAFHLFIVSYEEPHLRSVFGAEYDAYRAHVGRWLPGRPQ